MVAGLAVFWSGKRRTAAAILIAMVAASWIFGTAKGLLAPLAFGGAVWLLMGRLKSPWRVLGKYAALGGAAGTASLCWAFPLPVPPPLTGSHQVGTFALEIPAAGASPRLVAQVWYPSDEMGGKPAVPWLPDKALAPSFPYHRLAFAKSHARQDAPLANVQGPLPVIFYEHSWMGHRAENIAQVESLASEGFVIVAVDHPGQAERILYQDGSVVKGRYPEPLDFSSTKSVGDFVADARQCFAERLEQVERVRRALTGSDAAILSGRVQLDRAGVFGFSFGGSAAIQLCAKNPAFVAGANEDGLFLETDLPRGPFLFFDEETPAWLESARRPNENAGQILTREAEARIQDALKQPHRDRLILGGTRHLSFSDRIFASPIPRLARVGTRPAGELHEIVCERLAGFFKTELLKPK
jgi:dienelactone hydrolase